MSKNGKLLFRNYDPYITSVFGYRIHPITGKNTLHAGVDYGTNNQKLPTYAIEEGIVVKVGYSTISGNYVYVNYKRLKKNGLYQHLDSINVKVNQSVNKDTIIGYVGETGEVTGIHLHFGWFDENEQNKDWYSRNWLDFEKYEYQPTINYLGNPVLRDENLNQIQVLVNDLRIRKTPNGEILGYINKGFYNILNKEETEGYTWYQIDNNNWIAYDPSWTNIFLKQDETKEDLEVIIEDNNDLSNDESNNNSEILEENTPKLNIFRKIMQIIKEKIEKILNFFRNM